MKCLGQGPQPFMEIVWKQARVDLKFEYDVEGILIRVRDN